jgi:L-lactate dehydrogenase complex protein LldG
MSQGQTEAFLFLFNAVQGKVRRLNSLAEVPAALGDIAKAKRATTSVVAAPHPDLKALDFSGLEVAFREPGIADAIGLTRAVAGITETGSLVFFASAETPATLNFVPEIQVAVLKEGEIVAQLEDAWRLLDKQKTLPSTVNFITGPSRTGDIEQKLYLGAHGPGEVHLFLVKDG